MTTKTPSKYAVTLTTPNVGSVDLSLHSGGLKIQISNVLQIKVKREIISDIKGNKQNKHKVRVSLSKKVDVNIPGEPMKVETVDNLIFTMASIKDSDDLISWYTQPATSMPSSSKPAPAGLDSKTLPVNLSVTSIAQVNTANNVASITIPSSTNLKPVLTYLQPNVSLSHVSLPEKQKREELLKSNQALRALYAQFVETTVLTADEFWEKHSDLLHDSLSTAQSRAVPTTLIIKPPVETVKGKPTIKYNLDDAYIKNIFIEYPALEIAYKAKGKDMKDEDFFKKVFQSSYYHKGDFSDGADGTLFKAAHDSLVAQLRQLGPTGTPLAELALATSNSLARSEDLPLGYGVLCETKRLNSEASDVPAEAKLSIVHRVNRRGVSSTLAMVDHLDSNYKDNSEANSGKPPASNRSKRTFSNVVMDDLAEERPIDYRSFNIGGDSKRLYFGGGNKASKVDLMEVEAVVVADNDDSRTDDDVDVCIRTKKMLRNLQVSSLECLCRLSESSFAKSMAGETRRKKIGQYDETMRNFKNWSANVAFLLKNFWGCVGKSQQQEKFVRLATAVRDYLTSLEEKVDSLVKGNPQVVAWINTLVSQLKCAVEFTNSIKTADGGNGGRRP